jgi:hypothetical protein
LFARSVLNCENGTKLYFSVLLLTTSVKYENGLCRLTYAPVSQPV